MFEFKKITVNRPTDDLLFITKNGSYDVAGKSKVNVSVKGGGGADIKLFAPTIEIAGNTLVITDENGDFAECYEVYSNNALLVKATANTVNLAEYLTNEGTFEIKVRITNALMVTSEYSNVLSFTRTFGTIGLAYELSSDGTYYICSGIGEATDTDIIIPNSYNGLAVNEIKDEAFYNTGTLTSVFIAENIYIGTRAFSQNIKLAKVTVSAGVTSELDAFYNNYNLTDVTLKHGVKEIGDCMFRVCKNLSEIIIPSSVTNMGYSAFLGDSALKKVTILARIPPTLDKGSYNSFTIFNSCHESLKIYVPAESVEAYKAADGWADYAENIFAITE